MEYKKRIERERQVSGQSNGFERTGSALYCIHDRPQMKRA